MSIILRLISFIPFIAGPLVIRPPNQSDPELVVFYLKSNLIFVSTFAFFNTAKYLLGVYSALNTAGKRKSPLKLWSAMAAALVFSGLTLVSFAEYREFFDQTKFLMLLGAISSTTFAQMLYYRRRILPALVLWIVYTFIICLISLTIEPEFIQWQSILFALSLSGAICAVWVAAQLAGQNLASEMPAAPAANSKKTAPETPAGRLRLLHTVLLISAPLWIGFLYYAGQLSKHYLAVFLIIPLSGRLMPREGFSSPNQQLPPYFLAQTTGTCILFVGIIAALRVWLH